MPAFDSFRVRFLAGLFLAGLAGTPMLHASRTGLNNVPIAAVSEAHTGVVQAYSTFGADRKPALLSGARVGLVAFGERFEGGFDSRWAPGDAAPVFFNAKWASHWRSTLPALGIGVANLAPRSEDRTRLGQSQSYVVLSHDIGWVRIHGGYAIQANNDACFFGVDHSWLVRGHKLTFRSDLLQIQDGRQWLGSAGFTCTLTKRLGIEIWNNLPTKDGKSYVTGKLGYGFQY